MAHLGIEPLRHMGLLHRGLTPPDLPHPRRGVKQVAQVGDLKVEIRTLAATAECVDAWRALAERAVEPNVFYEPDFVLAAAQHLPEAVGHGALIVWGAPKGENAQMLAFWPLRRSRRALAPRLARGLAGRYASSGAPLIDSRFAIEAGSALIAGIRALDDAPQAAMFQQIMLDGAAARTLRAAATLMDLTISELDTHSRACVWREAVTSEAATAVSSKLRKEMGRMSRRLAALGDVRLATARSGEEARDAVELFLALEASGWKARRGTAILSDTRDAAFFRALTRGLARRGGLQVHLLEAGSRIAAAGLVLRSGTRAWYVKTSHDENLAQHSPGALLSHLIGEDARGESGLECLDSCAIPGHQMIERVWKDRVRIGDLAISLSGGADRTLAHERLRRRLRQLAKNAYHGLRSRLG